MEEGSPNILQIDDLVKKFLYYHHQTPTTEDGIISNEKIFAFEPRNELTTLKKAADGLFSHQKTTNN